MTDRKIFIIKADGTREEFHSDKLLDSLTRAGASNEVRDKIVHHIAGEIEDGMSTSAIYRHAFELLHKFETPVAARYSLKRAIADLGPSGFPFEKFVAEIFKAKGYETLTDQIVQGSCIDHEMDVVAWNENKLVMAEAKFHNELGMKSDLKVALYVKARFDDLKDREFVYGTKRHLDEGILITNTNFTEKAIQYCECEGVKLIGWNYPQVGNLHDMIEDVSLHPITCLTSLSNSEKRNLMEKGVVLCKSVRDNVETLFASGLSPEVIERAKRESAFLCPDVL
ncbi:MAG: ATP-cone domain protein [Parcubacteria group bacterium GW2011_GWA2_47_16]|nr:MAG: ATP-cone domain protein [Parcubacteria group bacterium GW2011_GWA2_47_16]